MSARPKRDLLVQRLDAIRRDLRRERGKGIKESGKPTPWRILAQSYPGVPPGTLCAIAKGRTPQKASVRAALGLPVTAPAPVCPRCGVVHYKTCRVIPEWVSRAADWLAERERN